MTIKRIMTAVAASGAALVIAASPTFAAQTAETHKHPDVPPQNDGRSN